MADTKTTHLELIKQDPDSQPDYLDDHANLDKLDSEIWARGKAFNGEPVGSDGGFHIRTVPYAENFETSSSQSSDDEFIIRTTGGLASVPQKGAAWLTMIKGTMKHTGYTPQSVDMSVIPMARPVPAAITAVIDNETFEAYVGVAGTYTITYTNGAWSTSPATYGITVSNTPVNGDSITVVWDGENDPFMTVDAVERHAAEAITATINEDTFVAYVSQSGTTTLTYSTQWSADPSLYGITVSGTPVAGDVITVVYVKEVRGTITQSNPEKFVSTGWNLYDNTTGRARVIKYSDEYNFKISGTYTKLEFAETISGTKTTITPVSGAFSIPSDGYLFVTGGNATDTAIWMTWSDWGNGYNWNEGTSQQGAFEAYVEYEIDFTAFMTQNFPYGLLAVGTAQDEINLNIGIATSRVSRMAYSSANLAAAKASGRQYEYDEDYIYLEKETPDYFTVEIDGSYTSYDHGMEFFTATAQDVYAQSLYGANLKNKLERDVLTISQQSLTSAEQSQVRNNIGAPAKIDGVYYGTSSTAASTQTKAVTVAGYPSALAAGQKLRVIFSNAQTYNGQPKLKVNSLSAVAITRFGTTGAARYEWQAGEVVDFIYDGTNWVMVGGALANGNYPGKVKLSNAYTSSGGAAADGVGASSKAVYDAYTTLNGKIRVFEIGQIQSGTIADAIKAAAVSISATILGDITIKFWLSTSHTPSDAPGSGYTRQYGFGEFIGRNIEAGAPNLDGTLIFYGWNSTQRWIRTVGNGTWGSWKDLGSGS